MSKLLIGTGNQAKVNTYKKLLHDFKFEVVSVKDLKTTVPEEKASTFEEEAVNKAKYYFEKSGIPTLADDGGMKIDALNGEPGIKSHRWLGHEMTDEEIVAEVMKRMKGVPKAERGCNFSVNLALATPFGVFTSVGEVKGFVPDKPSDKMVKGYPYDAVIFLPEYSKCVCELSDGDYEMINVRTRAFEKLKDVLKELSK